MKPPEQSASPNIPVEPKLPNSVCTDKKSSPFTKPVELFAKAIRNSSEQGGVICDPFAGSGTAVIAAEQLGRCAYLMEIDPGYCDVIVKRYATLKGEAPAKHFKAVQRAA